MCLAVPGEILARREGEGGLPSGRVRFGGAERDVCLAFVPEAAVGDYVLVHVGVAISVLRPDDAQAVLAEFARLSEVLRAEALT